MSTVFLPSSGVYFVPLRPDSFGTRSSWHCIQCDIWLWIDPPISSFMSIFSQTPTSSIQNTNSQMKQCWVNKAHETISRYLSKYRSFPLFCYTICDSVFVWRFKFLPSDASTISFPPQNLRSPCFSFSSSFSALLWLVRSHFLVVSICSQCHFEWVHIEPYSNFGANKWKCFVAFVTLTRK